jgi:hypothetical protein
MMRKLVTSVLAGDVFHEDEPRWLKEMQRRFPPVLTSPNAPPRTADVEGLR